MRMRHALLAGVMLALLGSGCTPVYCADSCRHAYDGECDDGRPGAVTSLCELGTDCSDCGANPNVQLADHITDPPSPPPAPGPPMPGEIPPPSSGGSCVCEAEYYCHGDRAIESCADQPPISGGGVSVATPCTTAVMACPGQFDSRVEYECRDGTQGVGCYALTNEYCEPAGTCPEGSAAAGTAIEYCARLPEFVGHFNSQQNFGRLAWRVSECEVWYQVGTSRTSCGACADACNVGLTGYPDPCEAFDPGCGDQFDCGDGECIAPSQVCNRASDCSNGRDESSSMCNSQGSCCRATRGCPGETGSSCSGSCCCCPGGQRCCTDWSGCCPA